MRWVAAGLVILSAAVLSAGLLVGDALRQQACIAKTEAQFPLTYVERAGGTFGEAFGKGVGWNIAAHHPRQAYAWREEQLAHC